jgi:hypothetical protein
MKGRWSQWWLVVVLVIFASQGLAREINCTSDGDTSAYMALLEQLDTRPLCGLSSQYDVAFRAVVQRPAGEPTGVTVYQSHLGEVEAVVHPADNDRAQLSQDQYVEVLRAFRTLDLFKLESHPEVVERLCALASDDGGADADDSNAQDCPFGADGSRWFVEASYGDEKRTVERRGGLLMDEAYIEPAFRHVVEQLYDIIDEQP